MALTPGVASTPRTEAALHRRRRCTFQCSSSCRRLRLRVSAGDGHPDRVVFPGASDRSGPRSSRKGPLDPLRKLVCPKRLSCRVSAEARSNLCGSRRPRSILGHRERRLNSLFFSLVLRAYQETALVKRLFHVFFLFLQGAVYRNE